MQDDDPLDKEIDLAALQPGPNPYASRTHPAALIQLDPDVAEVFVDGSQVNAVLRALIETMPNTSQSERHSA